MSSKQHEFDAVLDPDRLTVVDFSATWCGPCRMLEPILGELAAEMPAVDFLKLDVDRSQQLAIRYGVQAVPTLLVLRAGSVVDRLVGLRSKGALAERLRRARARRAYAGSRSSRGSHGTLRPRLSGRGGWLQNAKLSTSTSSSSAPVRPAWPAPIAWRR